MVACNFGISPCLQALPPIEVMGLLEQPAQVGPEEPVHRLFLSIGAQVHEENYFKHHCRYSVDGGVDSVFVDRTADGTAGAAAEKLAAADSVPAASGGGGVHAQSMWNEARGEPEALRLMMQALLRDVVAEERFMLALAGLGQEPVPRYNSLVMGLKEEAARNAPTEGDRSLDSSGNNMTKVSGNGGAANVMRSHRQGAALASAGGTFLEAVLEETLCNILAELRSNPSTLVPMP